MTSSKLSLAASDILVSVMVAPSIAAGVVCTAIATWRQLRGSDRAGPRPVGGKTSL